MSLVVNTNIASINSQRHLGGTNSKLSKSLERLSSGLRINSAVDDAAGIAIASKMGAQVRGLDQAIRNANNAITLTQTAEGGLNTMTNILQRLRELSIQSASDDNTQSDRNNLVNEANNLVSELTRMVTTTEYNTMPLLDGSFTGKYFQVGANYAQKVTFTISDSRAKSLGSRAQFDADVADGVANCVDCNFGGNEFKLNGYGVKSTSATDDQYSVLEITGGAISNGAMVGTSDFNTMTLLINNTSVDITLTSDATAASVVAVVVSAINGAGITNVSAFDIGSTWGIRATKGTDLELAIDMESTMTALSGLEILGMNSGTQLSTMFGSLATSTVDVINYNGQSSAIAKAVAINEVKTDSNITATVQSNTVTATSAVGAGSIASGDVFINGVNLGAVTVTGSDGTGALVSAVNNITSSTGVSATTDTDGKLILEATDGRNIAMSVKDDATRGYLALEASQFTNTSAVFRSAIRLTSEDEMSLTGSVVDLYDGANDWTKTADPSKSVATDQASYNIAAIEINTQANAESAMLTIDAALNDVNGIRAEIGAVQNRLAFTVANLEIGSENMSAARSQIMDADFAAETATFTRNQIMVQAATAILAQANTLPQQRLQLSQGTR
jgi:flagellin